MTKKTVPVAISSESKGNDLKLRFFDDCFKYTTDVKKNPESLKESTVYLNMRRSEIIDRISNKTGIPASGITDEIVEGMWSACQSEVAVFDNANNWCSVFNARDAEILEYAYDMSAYYTKGYGSKINYQIASPLFSTIMTNLEQMAINNNDGICNGDSVLPNAQLRFGHAETVMPLLALLGLYKDDEKLDHGWAEASIVDRKWRTSYISSLATNVAFVLYMCEDNVTSVRKPFVELLHDENIVYLPQCSNKRLCPLYTFKDIYKEYLSVKWIEICENGSVSRTPSMIVMVLVALIMMFRIN